MSRQCPHCRLAVKDGDLGGPGNGIYRTLRYDPTRATITALQHCTLEGAGAARRTTGAEPGPAPAAAKTGVPG
jgi:hypothetical protein